MRIHHLDCGPARPFGGALMDGASPGAIGRLTCHCLAIETPRHGVVLVDTGLGLRDMQRPHARLPWLNAGLLRFRFDPDRTMLRQLRHLGLSPRDVRHIVMTHLDFDHAGGLVDFPAARVHLMQTEAAAARARHGLMGRARWRPAQWGDQGRWITYSERTTERWFGFDAVALEGLPPELLLIPLPGHTPGHAGVAVEGPRGWMLHAGDAYFSRSELYDDPPRCPPGTAAYEWLMAALPAQQQANQRRLRELARAEEAPVAIFCTHDPVEYVAMAVWAEQQPRVANDAEAMAAAG
ncbi:MBL fold metallo-hydrolase [Siccirubricoccus sp. KC 17139]|uniref:MBL fold metallo-hydrolase n=1 Tax=Siccirubricoccus soli TaxID=2899147 RepID=A0ABT1D6N6_9PROT|nr:MBL fold metallo-hydrolase [Siccirubricoccus soli]MCO6417594.1 MBL fold metallo-hydrolase [Siccirubricoccus soli]MCP2683729.1 MBL fold metallo-hydrolase [Siccirubricoccus soli]